MPTLSLGHQAMKSLIFSFIVTHGGNSHNPNAQPATLLDSMIDAL